MKSESDIVRPLSSRAETWLVAGITVFILLASGIGVASRRVEDTGQRLFDWQISAFYDLKQTDQAVYSALLAASEELWWIHDEFLTFGTPEQLADPWPTVEQLSEEYLLPPFAQDVAWSQQGEIQWERIASYSFEGSTVYFGTGGTLPDQSAYLVMLSHVHKGAIWANGEFIWVHPDVNVPSPPTITRDSLIVNGWKEVVPYNGAMEVDRLKGE